MDLSIVALAVVACCTLYYYIKTKLKYFEGHGIPTVRGQTFLTAMFNSFFRNKHISAASIDMYKIHADAKYVGFYEFLKPVIMVRDLEIIKAITIKDFEHFPDHNAFIDPTADPLISGNLFSMSGDKWKESRNMLTPAFTSSKMKNMFELMVHCAKNLVNHLSNQPPEANRMVNTKDLFSKYSSDVIASCAFGLEVDSLKDPKNQFYRLGRKATKNDGLFQMVKFFIMFSSSKLTKLLGIKFVTEDVEKFFTSLIERTVLMREEKGISRPDMLQLMMDARDKNSKNLRLDTFGMTAQAFIFFFAGFETTSTQMCIITHELTINPDIQKRLQDEIDEVLKDTNGKPTYEAIKSMPYLDAVFNESMRKHFQNNMLDRVCKAPYELPPAVPGGKPFTVQPGMNIWIPASAIHHDPRYYENPEEFNPDRYYQKKVSINDVTNLGFGIGPRSCIGNRFAILETKILLFYLLSKFNLKANKKTCKPFKYSPLTFTIIPQGGYWLAVEPRS